MMAGAARLSAQLERDRVTLVNTGELSPAGAVKPRIIEGYAIISNWETAALLGRDGSIDGFTSL
jgi:hypothetical protein